MEIEIKLAPVSEAQFAQMLADPAVAPHLSMGEEVMQMEATYYDDIPGNLAQRKMTLRLRKENGKSVCTFKAPAEGDFARLEVECEAETVEEGVQKLLNAGKLPFPASALLSRMMLVPCCGARFSRLAMQVVQADFVCTLSYDRGELFAGDRTAPIAECEAELVAGTSEQLEAFFLPLAEKYGLPVCKQSKHARARALMEE